MKVAFLQRLYNITTFSIVFWVFMACFAGLGFLQGPLSEYVEPYLWGVVIGFPLWMAYDYWRLNR